MVARAMLEKGLQAACAQIVEPVGFRQRVLTISC